MKMVILAGGMGTRLWSRTHDNMFNARYRWTAFWMRRGGMSRHGRIATWPATLFVAPYKGRIPLARLSPAGYVSVQAGIHHDDLRLGRHCLIGDRVQIYRTAEGVRWSCRTGWRCTAI